MLAIFRKEFSGFFSNNSGVIVLILFLISIGSIVWIVPGPYNIFDLGYANLIPFFEVLPWLFSFLIPAICMRSFSEERKQGTWELLLTKPLSLKQLILGKFLSCFCISILALLPTSFYMLGLSVLKSENTLLDYGVMMSSYAGAVLLISCFTSIGIFASSLSTNQIVAFSLGAALSLFLYFGFEGLSSISFINSQLYTLDYLGLSYHFKSISRGVLDTKNLIYLLSISSLFLVLTWNQLKSTSE